MASLLDPPPIMWLLWPERGTDILLLGSPLLLYLSQIPSGSLCWHSCWSLVEHHLLGLVTSSPALTDTCTVEVQNKARAGQEIVPLEVNTTL